MVKWCRSLYFKILCKQEIKILQDSRSWRRWTVQRSSICSSLVSSTPRTTSSLKSSKSERRILIILLTLESIRDTLHEQGCNLTKWQAIPSNVRLWSTVGSALDRMGCKRSLLGSITCSWFRPQLPVHYRCNVLLLLSCACTVHQHYYIGIALSPIWSRCWYCTIRWW